MITNISALAFSLSGWKISGTMPPGVTKCMLVAAPHTTNFDLLFAMGAYIKMNVHVKYLIKYEWTKRPVIGRILSANGAIGVKRNKKLNAVENLAEMLKNSEEDLVLMVAPEGTRKMNKHWKTGFYQVALKAGVPIVLSYLDYKNKIAGIGPHFMPSGDYKKDMEILKEFYKDITPKYPGNFSLEIYDPDK